MITSACSKFLSKTLFWTVSSRMNAEVSAAKANYSQCPIPHDQLDQSKGRDLPVIDSHATGDVTGVVLVTGGAGFLGQHIVSLLHSRAPNVTEIRVFDLKPYTDKLGNREEKRETSFKGCLTDPAVLEKAMEGVSSVFHIAGHISYGTFPDLKQMNKINIDGTSNVIDACLKANVSQIIYCSTVDVAIGHNPVTNGNEENTPPPSRFLFPGYPESKYEAECLVLAANGTTSANGNKLQTLSLRANVMYGEGDPYYVTNGLRTAQQSGGTLYRVGNGTAKFQPVYAGNTAWAFLCAESALRKSPELGGRFYYVPDDSPLLNTFLFMKPFLEVRGFRLSSVKLPFAPIYYSLLIMEWLAKIISPVYKFSLPSESYTVKYINMDLYFSRQKAERELGFKPIFPLDVAMERSLKYYRDLEL